MYIVITGTSRGLGLALTRLALEKGHQVLALARAPKESEELMKLNESKNLTLLEGDIAKEDTPQKILAAIKDWPHLDLVINNAGVYESDDKREDFQKSFLINAIQPLLITKSLKQKLQLSRRPVAAFITSQMGSISDNRSGGSYSYRASKTALNMLIKSLSIDESWLISLLIHPGWVQTRMGGDNAPTSTQDSSVGIWKIIENANHSDSGSYQDFRGKILPW